MTLRSPLATPGPRPQACPEPPAAWTEELTATTSARAAATPAPVQLTLFVLDDVPARKPPRLRRLKSLLNALEPGRTGSGDVVAPGPGGQAQSGDTALPQAWLDSFFD